MRKEHYHNIDCLRFVFAIIIVYFHILHPNIISFVDGVNGQETYYLLQNMSNRAGHIVECFFIISGYFLFVSIENKSEVSFMMFAIKKIFRLAPVLIFSIVIGCLFFSQNLLTGLINSFFLQCIGLSTEFKGINWYISALFWASLFYYAILKNFERKKVNVIIAVIVYFSYLVNITACNGGFGRETVYGFVNLALARALAGIGLGYLLGLGLVSFKTLNLNYSTRILRYREPIKYIIFTVIELVALLFLIKYFLFGLQYQNGIIVVIVFSILFISFICKTGGNIAIIKSKNFFAVR